MIPVQYALRRKMMGQGKGNGPWTVTVTGEWYIQTGYAKNPDTSSWGNRIVINDITIPTTPGTAETETRKFEVETGTVISLSVAKNVNTSPHGYISVNGEKVVNQTPETLTWYSYEYVVDSDCTINGGLLYNSNTNNNDSGYIAITTT